MAAMTHEEPEVNFDEQRFYNSLYSLRGWRALCHDNCDYILKCLHTPNLDDVKEMASNWNLRRNLVEFKQNDMNVTYEDLDKITAAILKCVEEGNRTLANFRKHVLPKDFKPTYGVKLGMEEPPIHDPTLGLIDPPVVRGGKKTKMKKRRRKKSRRRSRF